MLELWQAREFQKRLPGKEKKEKEGKNDFEDELKNIFSMMVEMHLL